jgi:NADH-quinone oxidoreductase subunit B
VTGTAQSLDLTLAGRRVRLSVCHLGLACCGIEVRAALRLPDPVKSDLSLAEQRSAGVTRPRSGDEPPALNVLLVAGTITRATADTVRAAYDALPKPRAVLAFGACAISGGPYWDSYAVVCGAERLVPVDLVLPGCPPPPQDLRAGLEMLVADA